LWPEREGRGTHGGDAPSLCFHPPPMPSLPTKNTGMLPHFHLSIAPASVAVAAELSTQTAPLQLCLDLDIGCQASGSCEAPAEHGDTHPPDSADTPATSCKVGSFIYDKERGIYPLQWEDLSSFHAWRREKELAHSVELIASSTVSGGHLWLQKRIFVYARQLSSGPAPPPPPNVPSPARPPHVPPPSVFFPTVPTFANGPH
jgi:hypothetical protein